ncbi:dual specificity protein kinase splB isoform X2 [Culicoides brevitarsis]|uniref:dual specificity protein kinase splB isoform X2 n=1 Tax=Culicoides brevitarsis TaxID=469753 RepID=UPI00307C5044
MQVYREFAMSNAINVPQRDCDERHDRHLTSFSTFRVGSAEFNSPTPEPRSLLPQTPEPVEFEQLIEKLDVIPSNDIQLELVPCPICTRKFVPESLTKHVGICEKMAMKKRKVFDSSRQRIEGTELASYRPPPLPGMQSRHNSIDNSQMSMSKVTPPKTTPLPRKFERTPSLDRNTMRQESITTSSATSKMSSNAKRVPVQAQSEMCPYCERTFGFKAYDRHVEWCKEKALLKQMSSNNKETVSAAKERLQARIKYKAPSLKTKRQQTREKYSGGSLSCSGSTNSLNDLGIPMFKQKDFGKSDKKNSFSMANSMTSSMTSESGLSDRNYDPFMSAKRQLEELFSPTTGTSTSTSKNNNTTTTTTPTTNTSNKTTSKNNCSNSLMTSSMKVTPIVKPSTPTSSIPSRSSFRRTSSLRLSKKVSKPLFSQNTRSNIQRGLSPDDGPVSPHFVRANEYDEIPIKSAYNALHANKPMGTPSKSSTPIRATPPKTPSFDDTPILRRNNSADLRKNLKLELTNPNAPDFSVSKTDSLAVFLKYEKDLKDSSTCLTEKDLKDKSNSCLSKRSSLINESKENIVENVERLPEIVNKTPPSAPATPNNNRISPLLKLEPITKNQLITNNNNNNNNKPFNNNNDLICDALGLKVTKLSDSDNSSSGSSSSASAKSSSKRDDTPEKFIPNRGSGRNVLRRQVKLSKDSILYDFSPDSDPYSEECDQKISQLEAERDNNPHFKRNLSNNADSADLESIFDDFDFEEFISSFEDDENYPIFKDYKNILLSRTISDSKNIAARSEMDTDFGSQGRQTPRNSSSNTAMHVGEKELKVPAGLKVNLDELSPTEKDLLKSVSELNDMCSQSTYPVDSDDLSSIDGFPLRKQAGSKMSADSAYGSLSRQSPPERTTNRRNKARAVGLTDMLRMPDIQQNKTPMQRHQLRPRENNLSMSSSGSESSLPPINSNLKTQKMELHPHSEKQSNLINSSASECKLSKFCHECGSRFKVSSAKFCMDCGVKRIAIE